MKKFIFLLSDIDKSSFRTQEINASGITEAFYKLDTCIHDDEFVIDIKES